MKVSLILACAGKGTRAGFDKNKLLVTTNGERVLDKTLSVFFKSGIIDEYILACSKEDYDLISSLYKNECKIVLGGLTRTESVTNALKEVTGDIVLIHDGARPFVTEQIIKDCIDSAIKFGSGITAVPSRDTMVKVSGENIVDYLGKDGVYNVQTPQAFNFQKIKNAYAIAGDKTFNDDGEVYLNAYGDLRIVKGSVNNIKMTYAEDFSPTNNSEYHFGTGFDCHKLVENRKLILGGIEIPHDKGLLGHSDADVLTHAIMDAILSGAGLRDIGYYFPDTDENFKDADSIKLLEKVIDLAKEKGYKVQSISAVIMAQKPKLLKHIPTISENLSKVLNVEKENIGISATTLEGLGFVGREEGICVSSNVVLVKI